MNKALPTQPAVIFTQLLFHLDPSRKGLSTALLASKSLKYPTSAHQNPHYIFFANVHDVRFHDRRLPRPPLRLPRPRWCLCESPPFSSPSRLTRCPGHQPCSIFLVHRWWVLRGGLGRRRHVAYTLGHRRVYGRPLHGRIRTYPPGVLPPYVSSFLLF